MLKLPKLGSSMMIVWFAIFSIHRWHFLLLTSTLHLRSLLFVGHVRRMAHEAARSLLAPADLMKSGVYRGTCTPKLAGNSLRDNNGNTISIFCPLHEGSENK